MKIIVMGAGIVGLSTAYFLSRAGFDVQVLDQADGPAQACSFANGGQLSYSYTEPLASPGFLKTLPALMVCEDKPFAVRARSIPGLIGWGARFLKECTPERFAFNTTNILRLALYSKREMDALREAHKPDFGYRDAGKLHLYATEAALANAARTVSLKNRFGCHQQVLDAAQCLEHEPALQTIKGRIAGGVFSPLDACGDAFRFAQALMEICRHAGVCFDFNTRIHKILKDGQRISTLRTNRGEVRADAYVLCLGAQSPRLTKQLGIVLPILPGKGYSITVPAGPVCPSVNITDTRYRLVYSRLGPHFRIAGVMELAGYGLGLKERRLRVMSERAKATFPGGGDYAKRTGRWTGLRPLSPDSAPIIGQSPYANLYLNTGHGMLGWTLACGSAAIIANLVEGRKPAISLTGLAPDRF